MITFETFAEVFAANLNARSRTTKGISHTSTSTHKKALLKSGEELQRQVGGNTRSLIQCVWDNARVGCTADLLRELGEKWYDIISNQLQDPGAYEGEWDLLKLKAEELHTKTGLPYRVNRRYRIWNVDYSTLSPVELELAMDEFYNELATKITLSLGGELSQVTLLAYADYMLDTAIHPWSDGCARQATATVMWLSLLSRNFRLPIFGTREEHYRAIQRLETTIAYYELCMERVCVDL